MQINKATVKMLEEREINVNEALTTLFILSYGLEKGNTIMNDDMISRLSMAEMIDYDYLQGEYIVKVPLFEEGEPQKEKEDLSKRFTNEFLTEYVKIFKDVYRDRTADRPQVRNRLIKLITERDGTVTNEEILQAAKLHVNRISRERGPQYIMQADYFIWHKEKGFKIMQYIEEIRENAAKGNSNINPFEEVL